MQKGTECDRTSQLDRKEDKLSLCESYELMHSPAVSHGLHKCICKSLSHFRASLSSLTTGPVAQCPPILMNTLMQASMTATVTFLIMAVNANIFAQVMSTSCQTIQMYIQLLCHYFSLY